MTAKPKICRLNGAKSHRLKTERGRAIAPLKSGHGVRPILNGL